MSERERNRERMPEIAAFVDAMRAAFGNDQVRVLWARENGYEVGKPTEGDGGGLRAA